MVSARAVDKKRTALTVVVIALLSLVLGSGCSDPDDGNVKKIPAHDVGDVTTDVGPGDVEGGDVDSADTDADADALDVESDTESSDVDEADEDVQTDVETDVEQDAEADVEPEEDAPRPYPLCGPVVDLGWLMPGKQTVTVDLSTLENHLETQCAGARGDSNEAVFSFRLLEEGQLSVTPSSPVALELRNRPCEDNRRALVCSEEGLAIFMAGNEPRFLVVEALDSEEAEESGVLEIEIELVPTPTCEAEEADNAQCLDAATIKKCDVTLSSPDILRWTESVCPQGCSEDRCVGNSCEASIQVTERMEVQGTGQVLFDSHDRRAGVGCGPVGEEDPGYRESDLVFELPDLEAGNSIVVSTAGSAESHHVLIKSACDAQAACLGFFEHATDVRWEVPADGTYYVIIENAWWMGTDYRFVVDVE